MRWLALLALAAAAMTAAAVPQYGYEIVHAYPHDPSAFTEGLFYLNGYLYESTGIEGRSFIRKVELATGRVLQEIKIPPQYFGEGIVNWKQRLISLTYRTQIGFVYDLASLKRLREFSYSGEGWGLTQDGRRIIMSDGSAQLRFLDPDTLRQTGRLTVTLDGKPVRNLNELEWVNGEIFANVWQSNWILRIDPASGHVVGLINLAGLLQAAGIDATHVDVLNGIAYDNAQQRLFVTGKNWPRLFEIRPLINFKATQ